MTKITLTRFALVTVTLLTVAATGSPGQDASEIRHEAGKEGYIELDSTSVAGDLTLRPGHYKIQHRAADGSHFVRFTRTDWKKTPVEKTSRRVTVVEAEVNCEVEKLEGAVESTAFYTKKEGNTTRLTRVEIRGETMAHLF